MHRRTQTPLVLLAALCLSPLACQEKDDGSAATKAALEDAAKVASGPVKVIAAYQAHLDMPTFEGKYAPKNRSDLRLGCLFAANGIRQQANIVRQKLMQQKTPEAKALVEPFGKVTKTCATLDNLEEIAECKVSIKALDAALAASEVKAKAAGLTSFPRIVDTAIDDAAKKELEPFLNAKGPTANETALMLKLHDAKAKPADVIALCEKTHRESSTFHATITEGEKQLDKLSATHMTRVELWCNKLKELDGYFKDLETCKEKKGDECKELCQKAKRRIGQGLTAACFEPVPELFKEACEED